MRRAIAPFAVLAVGLCAIERAVAQEAPAEQYRKLLEACSVRPSGAITSDEERLQFVGRAYRVRNEIAPRFVELAEAHPADPIARDALTQAVWQVNTTPWPVELVGRNDAVGRALELLRRDHLQSDQLAPLCQRLSWGFCREYEGFLRAVAEASPHREVKAAALLSLAHYLNHRTQRFGQLEEQPDAALPFEELFGRDYVRELARREPAPFLAEADALLVKLAEEHGFVKLPDGDTIGERARSELFDLRHLRVGEAAPEIEGVDQDGAPLRLSSQRGKVVLLDFWSQV